MAGGHANLALVTTGELRDALLDVRQSLLVFAIEYEREELYNIYIDLGIDVVANEFGKRPGNHSSKTLKSSDFIASVVEGNKKGFHFILGDFGAGKTTFLTRLRYDLAKAHVSGKTTRKPLFIRLRDFTKFDTLDALLVGAVKDNFQMELPASLVRGELARGDLVLLLDGFDEISTHVSKIHPSDVMVQLCALIGPDTMSVLTSRPTYVLDMNELNRFIVNFNMLHRPAGDKRTTFVSKSSAHDVRDLLLELRRSVGAKYSGATYISSITPETSSVNVMQALSAESIDAYLMASDARFKSDAGVSWSDVKRFLARTYDLGDLVRRPILLSMVRDTVLRRLVDVRAEKIKLGLTFLYEAYTTMNFDREHEKGAQRRLLTVEGRQRLCEMMAVEMLKAGALSIRTNQFMGLISALRSVPGRVEPLPSQSQLPKISQVTVA